MMRDRRVPAVVLVPAIALLSGAAYLLVQYGIETFVSDASTRLAYQLRDEASALRRSGQPVRTPRPGHRSIGVARNLTGPTWYSTSYHLNFLEVPKDLVVSHAKDEPTIVTLELKDGKVLLTGLN